MLYPLIRQKADGAASGLGVSRRTRCTPVVAAAQRASSHAEGAEAGVRRGARSPCHAAATQPPTSAAAAARQTPSAHRATTMH